MTLDQSVARAIEGVVRQRFDGITIEKVEVREDEDHEGDEALFVKVVFDANVDDLDPARMVGITRALRDRLFEMDEMRFPYTSFISVKDYEDLVA